MGKRIPAILCAALFWISGCAAAHKAAVDECGLGARINDEKIEAAILTEFLGDKNIKLQDLTAKSFDGDVYLTGEYESPSQQARAVAIVKKVEGVNSLTPHLLPKRNLPGCGTGENLKIRWEIEDKLTSAKDLRSMNVHVRVLQCRVLLLGIVGTDAEIQKAATLAQSVKGVQEVKSYLRLKKQRASFSLMKGSRIVE
jgi:hyperosmotically inducible periplasmic protein